jgi:SAM-dependent methyltransferase
MGDVKIDLVDYAPINPIDHVLDLAVEDIPYPDETFDKIFASHVLEHIPPCVRWREIGEWHRIFWRVHIMKEIWRVLKPGGTLRAAVPIVTGSGWNQDPSHDGPPWSLTTFHYFCGQWGGDEGYKEATLSSGINFRFQVIEHFERPEGEALTVVMRKIQKS